MHPGEAGLAARRRGVVHLQDVHVLEVEGDAAARTVDLQPDRVLAAGGEAGGLEGGEGPTTQPGDEDRGVVDGHRAASGADLGATGR